MPIYQTNTFICEVCGKAESVTEEVGMYSNPVVAPPNSGGWEFDSDDKLKCPARLV